MMMVTRGVDAAGLPRQLRLAFYSVDINVKNMPYAMFYDYFPEIAKAETRNITIFEKSDMNLPAGTYSFLEMFCDEPGCDCRRVFFFVTSDRSKNVEAVIAYGWESPEFYAHWLKDDDPHIISELKGPSLNLGSPQSSLAPALLDLVRTVLLQDRAYLDRIKHHYSLFRAKIDGSGKAKPRHKSKKKTKRNS